MNKIDHMGLSDMEKEGHTHGLLKNENRTETLHGCDCGLGDVGEDGKSQINIGPGDDPTWSPDGFVTRAFPDSRRGGSGDDLIEGIFVNA